MAATPESGTMPGGASGSVGPGDASGEMPGGFSGTAGPGGRGVDAQWCRPAVAGPGRGERRNPRWPVQRLVRWRPGASPAWGASAGLNPSGRSASARERVQTLGASSRPIPLAFARRKAARNQLVIIGADRSGIRGPWRLPWPGPRRWTDRPGGSGTVVVRQPMASDSVAYGSLRYRTETSSRAGRSPLSTS